MYNQDIKNRFMWENEDSIGKSSAAYNAYEELFEISAPLETEKGRDLAELYRSEMAYLDELVETQSKIPPMRYKANLLRYFTWYKKKYPDAITRPALSWVLDSLSGYKRSIVSSPTHLQIELNKIFRPEDGGTIDIVYRSFFWIAFAGVRCREDADLLEVKDIDVESMTFILDGHRYPIYPQGLKAMLLAAKNSSLMYEHSNYKEGTVVYKTRVAGDKVLRGIKGDADDQWIMESIRKRTAAAAKEDSTAKRLSYRSVMHSGAFYRQYELEASGMDVDFSAVVKESRHGKTFSKASLAAARGKTNALFKDEYYIWKYLMYKDKV